MKSHHLIFGVVLLLLVGSLLLVPSGPYQGDLHPESVQATGPGVYNVTFHEQGLPANVYWGVSVNSSSYLSQGPEISVYLPNGTYNYTVSVENTSFRPAYPTGSFLLSGHPLAIPVQFENVSYPVVFNEKGLPFNSTWTVTIGTLNQSKEVLPGGGGDYMIFEMVNGTYSWNVSPSGAYVAVPQGGSIKVNGNLTVIYLQFEQVYAQVVFERVNLPGNISWFVDFNGSTKYSTSEVVDFIAPYGVYAYSAGANISSYHSFAGTRNVIVSTPTVYVPVHFWTRNYTVIFSEKGLPAGMEWSVRVGSYVVNSTNSSLYMLLQNGSYYYSPSVSSRSYVPVSSLSSLLVNGSNVNVTVLFKPVTYSIQFNRSGPSGVEWQITLGGRALKTVSPSIIFSEPPGNYTFNVSILNPDYSPSPSSGTVYLRGNATITVSFNPVTFTQTFLERGLAPNQSWSVRLGNTTLSSTKDAVSFQMMNGSYNYTVSTDGNYTISPSSGILTVSGSAGEIDILFTPFAHVSFEMSGLPKGSSWSVTIDGKQVSSSSSVLSMQLPLGTYYYAPNSTQNFTYSVSLPSGYSLVNESSFNTSSAVISLVAEPLSPQGGSSMGGLYFYVLIAVGGVAIAMLYLVFMRRGGRKDGGGAS